MRVDDPGFDSIRIALKVEISDSDSIDWRNTNRDATLALFKQIKSKSAGLNVPCLYKESILSSASKKSVLNEGILRTHFLTWRSLQFCSVSRLAGKNAAAFKFIVQ